MLNVAVESVDEAATPIEAADATRRYGVLLEFAEGRLRDARSLSAVRSHLSWRRLDLDALRMYLQWRDLDLASVRADPDRYRDPDSLPDDPNPPGTGSIATSNVDGTASAVETDGGTTDDPWGAEAFLDDIEGDAYGTTPEMLRDGLETLTEEDVVWISPGIPFIVPMFFGLVVSFVYGDLLFTLLGFLGLA